ncbi:MAG: HAD family hydrolase [Sphaerochaetaceae bacterium]
MKQVKAVCFDIDGTLYPKWQTNWKLLSSLFPSPLLAFRYNAFRKEVRKPSFQHEKELSFREQQAQWISKGRNSEKIKMRIEQQMYATWRKSFATLGPFKHVRETFVWLKEEGFSIGVLSDFPIENKLDALKVADLVDYSMCSEESGYLKPHPAPFYQLCDALDMQAHQLLYVGDSCFKDVQGAAKVGMKTCFFTSRRHVTCSQADMMCSSYIDLQNQLKQLLA